MSSTISAATQTVKITNTPSATQDPTDLYRFLSPQSLQASIRIANAPRISRKIHPNKITMMILGFGRSIAVEKVLTLPQAGQGFPTIARSPGGNPALELAADADLGDS
jgi:hypothetical protein